MYDFDSSLGKQCCTIQIQHNHEANINHYAYTNIVQNSLELLPFLPEYVENKDRNLTQISCH